MLLLLILDLLSIYLRYRNTTTKFLQLHLKAKSCQLATKSTAQAALQVRTALVLHTGAMLASL
jgi:hypothetical protein